MSQIKISGFTFIKHGLTLGYPFLESIQSISPFCDEIIVNVGFDDPDLKSDDGTLQYLEKNLQGPKYKILKSYWNPQQKEKGLILSEQTNIALKECQGDYFPVSFNFGKIPKIVEPLPGMRLPFGR